MWSIPGTMCSLWDLMMYMDTDTLAFGSAPVGVEGRWQWRCPKNCLGVVRTQSVSDTAQTV